jgi:hypothetical protein
VEDTVERMGRLRRLHAAARWPDLADECHDLCSTLGTFGASGSMALAREAMDAARLGDRDRLDRLMPRLLDRTVRMADLLRARVADGPESTLPASPTGAQDTRKPHESSSDGPQEAFSTPSEAPRGFHGA